jgi:GWxTD domain-containing protein
MRRFLPSLILIFSLVASLAAATLPELFQKAKDEFRLASYAEALKTLDQLDKESEKPGNAEFRSALRQGITFYRGACLAALGRAEEAREQFEIFLVTRPGATLDPSIYPKSVITAFESARRPAREKSDKAEDSDPGALAKSYKAFSLPAVSSKKTPSEEWAEGPIRYLLTPQERKDFSRISDPVSRSDFIVAFWKARDPRPETPENEFQEEFQRRVAFADAHLVEGETRGSLTDRGMVFILLGPPTYVGRHPLNTGDDTADPAGLSRYSHNDVVIASKPGGTTADRANRIDQVTGPAVSVRDAAAKSWVETWHYRRELLPAGLPFQQVDFAFVTKQGYGKNVLQRDPDSLAALERSKEAIRRGVF